MAPVSNDPKLALSELSLLTAGEVISLYTPLENLDQNQDALLDFSEVKDRRVPVPNDLAGFTISTPEHFKSYGQYLKSFIQSRLFVQKNDLDVKPFAQTPTGVRPEDWQWQRVVSGQGQGELFQWDALHFLDQRDTVAGTPRFLVRWDYPTQGPYMMMDVSSSPEQMSVQVGEYRFLLLEKQKNTAVENLRLILLKGLCVYLTARPLSFDESLVNTLLDILEGHQLVMQPELIRSAGQPRIQDKNKAAVPEQLAERLKNADAGFPGRDVDLDWVGFELPHGIKPEIYGENPLSPAEKKSFKDALEAVPDVLYRVMAKQGLFAKKQLEIEIREPDLINVQFSQAAGFYSRDKKKVVISRAYLAPALQQALINALVHEFAHAADGRDGKDGKDWFGNDYYAEVQKDLTRLFNPFVSLYASKTSFEFFAESIVAYLRGETDPLPVLDFYHGRRDQAELRRKTPEMYLALKLYLEPGPESDPNPYFGDTRVLNKESLACFKNLVKTCPDLLLPSTSLGDLINAYSGINQSCSDSAEVWSTMPTPEF